MWKLENIPLYEVPVSRKRPHKEVRLQVTLEGGYSSRVSEKRWKRVPDTCPCNRKGTVADCHSPVGRTTSADVDAERKDIVVKISSNFFLGVIASSF